MTGDVTLNLGDPFEAAVAGLVRLNRSKRADYAEDADPWSNFRQTGEFMGLPALDAVLFNLAQKMVRLRALRTNDRAPGNESVRDTYRDLAVYATIAVALLDEAAPPPPPKAPALEPLPGAEVIVRRVKPTTGAPAADQLGRIVGQSTSGSGKYMVRMLGTGAVWYLRREQFDVVAPTPAAPRPGLRLDRGTGDWHLDGARRLEDKDGDVWVPARRPGSWRMVIASQSEGLPLLDIVRAYGPLRRVE